MPSGLPDRSYSIEQDTRRFSTGGIPSRLRTTYAREGAAAAAVTEEFRLQSEKTTTLFVKPDDQILSMVLIGVFGARWIQIAVAKDLRKQKSQRV